MSVLSFYALKWLVVVSRQNMSVGLITPSVFPNEAWLIINSPCSFFVAQGFFQLSSKAAIRPVPTADASDKQIVCPAGHVLV